MSKPSFIGTLLFFIGMLLTFVGERVIGAGGARWLSAVGVLLVTAAVVLRAVRAQQVAADRRSVERLLLGFALLGLLALAVYFLQSDLAAAVLGQPLERNWPKLATVLAALWPALWLFSALPTLLTEVSYASAARAPKLEARRLRDAAWSGVGLAGAIVFAVSMVYVGTARDKRVDLSYFRTAKPGESTRKLVRTLDQPVQVSLFFPPSNEVRGEVADYFGELQQQSKLLEVHNYDHDIDLEKAKQLGVSGNGTIVIARGNNRQQMALGLELQGARNQLRNLDRNVQERLLKVARPARVAYFVVGHGERGFDPASETDKRATLRDLRALLQEQSYNIRTLSAADGLAADVPNDASLVILAGPQKALAPEETASLLRYFDRGGRLFVAVDPEAGQDLSTLLAPMGLTFVPTTLCSDLAYARKSNQLSDRQNIVTASFSSHPSVTTLGHVGGRAPLILVGAGHLEESKRPKENLVSITVRSHPSTWADANGNFNFDPPKEERHQWNLAAAVTHKGKPADAKAKDAQSNDGRAIVLADSDLVSDGVVGAQGNPLFVLDGVRWLAGDESIAGEINSEEDVPIVHTKKQDAVWFYGSAFLAPMLVLGIGLLVTRRRSRKERQA